MPVGIGVVLATSGSGAPERWALAVRYGSDCSRPYPRRWRMTERKAARCRPAEYLQGSRVHRRRSPGVVAAWDPCRGTGRGRAQQTRHGDGQGARSVHCNVGPRPFPVRNKRPGRGGESWRRAASGLTPQSGSGERCGSAYAARLTSQRLQGIPSVSSPSSCRSRLRPEDPSDGNGDCADSITCYSTFKILQLYYFLFNTINYICQHARRPPPVRTTRAVVPSSPAHCQASIGTPARRSTCAAARRAS